MATAYWAGGTSTDTNTAANWVDSANGTNPFGSVPGSADDVIIQSTSNSNVDRDPTQNAAHTFNSIEIESGGHWTADGSNNLTLSGENGSHFAFANSGTFTHTNGTVVINNGGSMSHAAIQNGHATSTTGFYDLTISGVGTTCEIYGDTTIRRNMEAGGSTTVLRGHLTVTGNLTVGGGTLNTRYSSTDRNLTVTGKTTIGDASYSSEDQATLTCNASTISLGSGKTDDWAIEMLAGGTFAGGIGTHTTGAISQAVANTKFTFTSGTTTINSESGDRMFTLTNGKSYNSDGRITLQGTFTSYIRWDTTAGDNGPHNLRINDANLTVKQRTDLTVEGYLKIDAGTFTTLYGASTSQDLTVTEYTQIGDGTAGTPDEATLTCNASTCSFGSGYTADYGLLVKANGTFNGGSGTHTAGGFYMDQNADAKATLTSDVMTINSEKTSANKCFRVEYGGDTFNNNNGTVKFAFNGFDSRFSMRSEGHANNAFHNLIIAHLGDTRTLGIDNGSKLIVDNDLTITRGILSMNTAHELEVVGDVVIDDGTEVALLRMGAQSTVSSQAASFGSLTIGNDGTYSATSGTTTITNRKSGLFSLDNSGTFTNNDGTVLFSGTHDQHVSFTGSGNMHHCTVNKSDNDLVQRSNLTIEGDLNITTASNHDFRSNDGTWTLDVTGDATLLAGRFGGNTTYTTNQSFGSLTITSGDWRATSATTTINAGSFDNDGTFTHNDGEVILTYGGGEVKSSSGLVTTTFYKLESQSYCNINWSINCEYWLKAGTGHSWRFYEDLTVTLGTSTVQGQIITGTTPTKGLRFTQDKTIKFAASNALKPWIATDGGAGWNIQTTGVIVQLENGDMQFDFVTDPEPQGDAGTYQLTGDMEFDAVTVSSGDTLDLNGQRAEFGGLLNVDGAMDYDGLVFLHDGIDHDGTSSNTRSGKLIFATNTTNCDTASENFDLIMINHPSFATSFVGGRMATNMLIGCGEYRLAGGTSNPTNLTIATGGELDDRDSGGTVNVAGDFTTSGGLIGTSALTFDGDNDIAYIPDNAAISGLTNMSMEAWAKYDSTGPSSFRFILRKNAEYILGINTAGYFYGMFHDGTAERDFIGNVDLRDDKWHHFAGTWDSSTGTGRFYLDGKLIGTSSGNAVAINNHTGVLTVGGRDADGTCSSFMDGCIDEIRIWNDTRTESEIRAGMFGTYSSSEAGLAGRWACDEGTGTTVADSSSNSNTLTFGAATGGTGGAGANPPSWAGTGTFDEGSSTLVMTGTDKRWYMGSYLGVGSQVNNFTVNGTITLQSIGYDYGAVYHTGGSSTFTLGAGGTLSSHANESLYFSNPNNTIDVSANTDGLANLSKIRFRHSSGNNNLPEMTTKFVDCETSGGTVTATGDITLTEELEVNSGTTFNANGNTITASLVDLNGTGTLRLGASSLVLDDVSGGLTSESGVTLNAGPGCSIDGNASGQKVPFQSQGHWEIVGNISDLNVTNEELAVFGKVTNCTGDIHQWLPHFEKDVMLDAGALADVPIDQGDDIDRNNELLN